MTGYNSLDDAMLDHQANQIDPKDDMQATVVVASWSGALQLAETRATYFGQQQTIRQIRNYRIAGLRLAIAWAVGPA